MATKTKVSDDRYKYLVRNRYLSYEIEVYLGYSGMVKFMKDIGPGDIRYDWTPMDKMKKVAREAGLTLARKPLTNSYTLIDNNPDPEKTTMLFDKNLLDVEDEK
jgi:hypothetical protein